MRSDHPLFVQLLTHSLLFLLYVMSTVYYKLEGRQRIYEFYSFSVRHYTTFKDALDRGNFVDGDDKDSRGSLHMQSGIP